MTRTAGDVFPFGNLHVARCLRSDPEALALLLESAGPAALALLGRALHRRVERLETTAG